MKKIAAIATCAALAFSMLAFVGCGGESDEDVIRGALTEDLESIKAVDEAFLTELTANMDASAFATYGIDANDFMKAYLEGFDYTIDSVTVDGDTAKAVVTLTCKSFSAYEAAVDKNTQTAIETQNVAAMSQAEVNALVGQLMMDSLKDVEVVTADPITLVYENVDDTWTPTEASKQGISNALLNN